MSFTVALTGGIGSGKSTVATAFSRHGVTVIDADIIARQMVAPGTPALKAISQHFGPSILLANGELDRRALRERIFSYPQEKAWVNALLHPLIQQETRRQIAAANSPYVLWVVPLLLENQLHKLADRVLVVDVSQPTQITRTMQRDNVSHHQVEQIIRAQASRAARLAIADDIINNDSPDARIDEDVARLHQCYLKLAGQAAQEND